MDDELEPDYIRDRLEDYFDSRVNMDIYDHEGEDSWLVPLQRTEFRTSIDGTSKVTYEKMED